MQVFQQLFFHKNVNFYSNRTLSNPSVFYEAIQHFFDGFPKSVGRLRRKKSTAVCVLECGEGEKVFILQNKKNPSLLRFYYQKTPFSP